MTDASTLDEMIDRGAKAHAQARSALTAGNEPTLLYAALVRETIAEIVSIQWPEIPIGVARARIILRARERR